MFLKVTPLHHLHSQWDKRQPKEMDLSGIEKEMKERNVVQRRFLFWV